MASLYPEDKTAKLNSAHAWWPGGLVIGGLLGVDVGAISTGAKPGTGFFRTAKVRDAIDRLKELRTALISAAVTGKIDVREEVA